MSCITKGLKKEKTEKKIEKTEKDKGSEKGENLETTMRSGHSIFQS